MGPPNATWQQIIEQVSPMAGCRVLPTWAAFRNRMRWPRLRFLLTRCVPPAHCNPCCALRLW